MDSPVGIEPVQRVEGRETLEIFTDEGSLLGVDPDMDLEGVGGEEGLATALTPELELPGVSLLMGLEVTLSGVAPGAASPGAHKPLTRHVVTDESLLTQCQSITLTMFVFLCIHSLWHIKTTTI